MMTRESRADRRALWIAISLFLFSLAFTGALALSHDKVADDPLAYYETARTIAQEGRLQVYVKSVHHPDIKPPYAIEERVLYPLLLALPFKLFGASVPISNLVSAIFRSLLIFPLFWLGKSLFDTRVAVAASLLYAVNPFYSLLGMVTMPDMPFVFLFYASVLMLLISIRNGGTSVHAAAGGIFAGLAFLIRLEGALLWAFGVAILLIWKRRDLVPPFLIAPLLALAANGAYLWSRFGDPFYTPKHFMTLPAWAFFYALRPLSWPEYLNHVGGISGAIGIRFFNYLAYIKDIFSDGLIVDTMIGWLPLTFLVALGASALALRREDPLTRRFILALSTFLLIGLIASIGYFGWPFFQQGELRQAHFLAPFLILMSGYGLVRLWDAGGTQGRWRRVSRPVAVALVLNYGVFALLQHAIVIDTYILAPPPDSAEIRGLRWGEQELPQDAIVISRKPWLVYQHARRTSIAMPLGTFAEMMGYARDNGVTHLTLTRREVKLHPNLVWGLEEYSSSFRVLFSSSDLRLYQVRDYDFLAEPTSQGEPKDLTRAKLQAEVVHWPSLWNIRRFNSLLRLDRFWGHLGGSSRTLWTSGPPTEGAVRNRLHSSFDQQIELLGYEFSSSSAYAGDEVQTRLLWRCRSAMPVDYTVFLHVLDGEGNIVAQTDEPPLGGALPTSGWILDEVILDLKSWRMPPQSPSGVYQVWAGWYHPQTMKRLSVEEAEAAVRDDAVYLGSIEVR